VTVSAPTARKLLAYDLSPIAALHRAVAIAETDGPQAALAVVDSLDLDAYYLLHAIRADLLHRLGRDQEAAAAYQSAIKRTAKTVDQDHLRRSIRGLRAGEGQCDG
jgi:RNA polymerase sigma-70 factor (ECF subfamily)